MAYHTLIIYMLFMIIISHEEVTHCFHPLNTFKMIHEAPDYHLQIQHFMNEWSI